MIHPKVRNGTAAAAVSGIIVWALGKYVLHGQADAAETAEIYAVVPAVLTFAAGYLTPARKPSAPVADPRDGNGKPLRAADEKLSGP